MSNRLEFTDPPWGILSDDDARAMAAGFDTAPEELKPWAAAKLIQHEAFRREYPKPLSAEEQANHRRRFNLLACLAEDWDGTSAKQDAETQEALALKLAPDRERARVLTWNKLFMARELGAAPEGTVVYETRRRQLAKGMFGGEGVSDDVSFFNAAKNGPRRIFRISPWRPRKTCLPPSRRMCRQSIGTSGQQTPSTGRSRVSSWWPSCRWH